MKRKRSAEAKIFFGFVVPYVCVLLVPLFVWTLSHAYIIQSNEGKVKSLISSSLTNSINSLDNDLRVVEDVIFRMSQNNEIKKYFELEKIDYHNIVKYQQLLSSYFINDGVLGSLSMYNTKLDCTVGTNSYYSNIHDLVSSHWPGYQEGLSEKEREYRERLWINGYDTQWEEKSNNSKPDFSYIRTMPINYPKYKKGNISAEINAERIYSHFARVIEEGEGFVYIFAPSGELVLSNGSHDAAESLFENVQESPHEIEFDGKKMYSFTFYSQKNQWKYCILVKPEFVMHDVRFVNTLLTIVNLTAFLIGILICLYLAYGRNKSHLSFASVFGVNKDAMPVPNYKSSEFELWQPHIEAVINENKRTKENAVSLEEERRKRTLGTLLLDKEAEDVLKKSVEESNMVLDNKYHAVMVIQTKSLNSIEGTNSKNRFLVNELNLVIEENFHAYVLNSTTILLLLSFDAEPTAFYEQFRTQLARMNLDIFMRYHIQANVGVGSAVTKLSEISLSQKEAMSVVAYNRLTDTCDNVFYFELPQKDEMYYYPIEIESGLISAITMGKIEQAIEILNTIYEENFTKRTLSYGRINELLSELEFSLNKAQQFSVKEEKQYSGTLRPKDVTVKQFFDYARNLSYAIGDSRRTFDDNAETALVKNMKEYIVENCGNYELSRDTLAEEFNLSSGNYVSKLFNKNVGETFFAFLERIRIEKACKLLQDNIPVNEVAQNSGYLNDQSFRRAFKKRMGVTPSEYVALNKKEK